MMQWECAEKQYIYIKKKGLIQLFQWIMAPVRHEPRSVNTKKAFDWLAVINPLTHTLPYVVWQHPIYSWDFLFFFKCNRAHVCTLLGITNRLKVVVEAGEEHLYAAWDEPGSAEGKTALVPSRWPAGAPPPLTFFTGCLESILISLKPRLLCPQQGRGRNEQIVQGGRIKCEIEMSKIIHLNLPRHSFIA